MSLRACIPDLLATGKIRKADADRAQRSYDRHYRILERVMGPDAAAAQASELALGELEHAAALKRRQAGLIVASQKRLDDAVAAGLLRGKSPYSTLVATLRAVEIARDRIEFQAHANLDEFLQRHRRNLLGSAQDRTGLVDVVRELHGQDTGNATAKAFAKAIGETFEELRTAFNRAGGDIGQRADFGMPHRHDPLLVRKAGLEAWKAFISDRLDLDKMIDPLSGGRFTPERLDEFLGAAWSNIATNGLADLTPSGGMSSRMLANRRADPRVLTFKDGEAWLEYAAKFGEGNPFEAIMSHVTGMARDIAMMEKLGPNPLATWKRGMQSAAKISAESDVVMSGAIKGTSRAARRADKMWRFMNGDMSIPVVPEGDTLAAQFGRFALNGLHAARDLLTAAWLGSAAITGISDRVTSAYARKFNGIAKTHPFFDSIFGYLTQLNPLDREHRAHAIQLLAGAREAARSLHGLGRFYGEVNSPRWSQVMADGVLRVTGLNAFFEAGRHAFHVDFMRQLASERLLGWDALPQVARDRFERHGIGAEDWDKMRAADVDRFRGGEYMDWREIAKEHPDAANKMIDMALEEGRTAVVEADAESQSITRFDRPGTLAGEIAGNTFQFKSFPLALIMSQARRVAEINERYGRAAAAKYAASFLVSMWMTGAVIVQAKEIVQGRDMRPMDNFGFWRDAMLQAGGLGIIGDLFGAAIGDRVDGVVEYFAGPTVQAAQATANTIKAAIAKDKTTGRRGEHAGREAVKFLRRHTPGTTIWYLRAAMDRLLWDEMSERMDPDYADARDRIRDQAQQRGQDYFYAPGDTLPHRLPKGPGETPPQ